MGKLCGGVGSLAVTGLGGKNSLFCGKIQGNLQILDEISPFLTRHGTEFTDNFDRFP
jgi:hypothetical protein